MVKTTDAHGNQSAPAAAHAPDLDAIPGTGDPGAAPRATGINGVEALLRRTLHPDGRGTSTEARS